jgi:hypothetical protein
MGETGGADAMSEESFIAGFEAGISGWRAHGMNEIPPCPFPGSTQEGHDWFRGCTKALEKCEEVFRNKEDVPATTCSASELLGHAKEHIYDAAVCNRLEKPAHSLGYVRLGMEKLAQTEKALRGLSQSDALMDITGSSKPERSRHDLPRR